MYGTRLQQVHFSNKDVQKTKQHDEKPDGLKKCVMVHAYRGYSVLESMIAGRAGQTKN